MKCKTLLCRDVQTRLGWGDPRFKVKRPLQLISQWVWGGKNVNDTTTWCVRFVGMNKMTWQIISKLMNKPHPKWWEERNDVDLALSMRFDHQSFYWTNIKHFLLINLIRSLKSCFSKFFFLIVNLEWEMDKRLQRVSLKNYSQFGSIVFLPFLSLWLIGLWWVCVPVLGMGARTTESKAKMGQLVNLTEWCLGNAFLIADLLWLWDLNVGGSLSVWVFFPLLCLPKGTVGRWVKGLTWRVHELRTQFLFKF